MKVWIVENLQTKKVESVHLTEESAELALRGNLGRVSEVEVIGWDRYTFRDLKAIAHRNSLPCPALTDDRLKQIRDDMAIDVPVADVSSGEVYCMARELCDRRGPPPSLDEALASLIHNIVGASRLVLTWDIKEPGAKWWALVDIRTGGFACSSHGQTPSDAFNKMMEQYRDPRGVTSQSTPEQPAEPPPPPDASASPAPATPGPQ